MMCAKKRSDGKFKAVESGDGGEIYAILCGLDESGNIRPVKVDDQGRIILST
jgi:hypothetical protein